MHEEDAAPGAAGVSAPIFAGHASGTVSAQHRSRPAAGLARQQRWGRRRAAGVEGQGRGGRRAADRWMPRRSTSRRRSTQRRSSTTSAAGRRARRTGKYESDAPDLFADFNGIPEIEDKLKYYEHDTVGLKWSNRLILGDSLAVMASLAEKEALRGKVQMIYLDPPYGIKFNSNWQVSTRDREVKDGKHEAACLASRKSFARSGTLGPMAFIRILSYLRDRLVLARELLAEQSARFLFRSATRTCMSFGHYSTKYLARKISSARSHFKRRRRSTAQLSCQASTITSFGTQETRAALKYRQLYQTKGLGGEGALSYTSCRRC